MKLTLDEIKNKMQEHVEQLSTKADEWYKSPQELHREVLQEFLSWLVELELELDAELSIIQDKISKLSQERDMILDKNKRRYTL